MALYRLEWVGAARQWTPEGLEIEAPLAGFLHVECETWTDAGVAADPEGDSLHDVDFIDPGGSHSASNDDVRSGGLTTYPDETDGPWEFLRANVVRITLQVGKG